MARAQTGLVATLLLVMLAGCTPESSEPPRKIDAAPPVDAAPAYWRLDAAATLSADSTEFDVLVTNAACNGGFTGEAYAPDVEYSDSHIVITFTLSPITYDGPRTCQANEEVPFTVNLEEPLAGRSLMDGECTGPDALTASHVCDPVRWGN